MENDNDNNDDGGQSSNGWSDYGHVENDNDHNDNSNSADSIIKESQRRKEHVVAVKNHATIKRIIGGGTNAGNGGGISPCQHPWRCC